ncbi:MAG: linear amide C-N hydrolase [Clostridia bacterium]|nr:linear amide C-N hydrolase [Clostridia bacterium]
MKNSEYRELRKKTLDSLKRVDNTLWMMEYFSPYGLDALLAEGKTSLLGAVSFLQKEVKFPHLIPDPAHGGFACSTFNAKTPAGDCILARNFDFKEAPCTVVWTHPQNGYRSMAVADNTFFAYGIKHLPLEKRKVPKRVMAAPYASMDGINEKGLACAVLEIKAKPTKQQTGKTPIMTMVALRAILDKCATVGEAVEFLRGYDMRDLLGVNYHYHFADVSGGSVLVEYVNNEMYVINPAAQGAPQVLTNYFLTEGGDNSREMGRDRFENISCALEKSGGIMTEADAMKVLSENTLSYHHDWMPHMVYTLWSNVFNLTQRSMILCAGMDYTKTYRFTLDAPCRAELL